MKTTDYIEGFVYENKALSHFKMAEGRVRNNSGSLKYEYMIADNMGNVRVSFEEVSGVAVVRQENSYYPFGMIMPGGYLPSSANKNLYNAGSEWQDDFSNLPDYYSTFYRNYDAALGRFIAVDPRAEATESLTTYHYGLNNPVMNNDPNGDISQTAWNNMLRLVERGLNNMDEDGYVFNENTGDNGTPLFRQGREIGYYENTGIEFFKRDRSGINEANGVYAGNSQHTWAFIPLGLLSRTQQIANPEGEKGWADNVGLFSALLGPLEGGADDILRNRGVYLPRNEIYRGGREIIMRTPIANIRVSSKVLNYARIGGEVLGVTGVFSAGYQVYSDVGKGNYYSAGTRAAVAGLAAGAAFIPVVGWGVALGIGVADYVWGDQFYNYIETKMK